MNCKIPWAMEEYLQQVENGIACEDQKALAKMIRKTFAEEQLYIDEAKLEKYLSLEKYLPFKLFPWEKFMLCAWNCVYRTEDNMPRWDTVFCMVGRGAGKDGYISFDAMCSISPFNPVEHCDVDICANNEDQATRPLADLVEILETPANEKKLAKHFYHTKEIVRGIKNKGVMKGHTNNPKGRDGLRSAKIIFNEVHQYSDRRNIEVFTSGLGKRAESRTGFFTSNGYVEDGVLDELLKDCKEILFEDKPDGGMLPFICRLNSKEEVHDSNNWNMANPSLQYMPALQKEIAREYRRWKDKPEDCMDFIVKRMGLRLGATDVMVTDYENIRRTNKPLPDLKGCECIAGIDYALLNDWVGVNLHFKKGEERYDINHAFICSQGRDLERIKAPYKEWAKQGHVTIVDAPAISPQVVIDYLATMRKKYKIKIIAMDRFRATLFADGLQRIGFDINDRKKVKLIRTTDIMQAAPIIDYCFDNDLFTWGDAPQLRWATNNTKRVRSRKNNDYGEKVDTGNFYYSKIEPRARKTDPFMALVASMTCEDQLKSAGAKIYRPPFGAVSMA